MEVDPLGPEAGSVHPSLGTTIDSGGIRIGDGHGLSLPQVTKATTGQLAATMGVASPGGPPLSPNLGVTSSTSVHPSVSPGGGNSSPGGGNSSPRPRILRAKRFERYLNVVISGDPMPTYPGITSVTECALENEILTTILIL